MIDDLRAANTTPSDLHKVVVETWHILEREPRPAALHWAVIRNLSLPLSLHPPHSYMRRPRSVNVSEVNFCTVTIRCGGAVSASQSSVIDCFSSGSRDGGLMNLTARKAWNIGYSSHNVQSYASRPKASVWQTFASSHLFACLRSRTLFALFTAAV